jgi:hypothetical protein
MAIAATRYAGVGFFGVTSGSEVTDTCKTLAGNVAIQTPEIGFTIGDLLAKALTCLLKHFDAVDFIIVKGRRHTTGSAFG